MRHLPVHGDGYSLPAGKYPLVHFIKQLTVVAVFKMKGIFISKFQYQFRNWAKRTVAYIPQYVSPGWLAKFCHLQYVTFYANKGSTEKKHHSLFLNFPSMAMGFRIVCMDLPHLPFCLQLTNRAQNRGETEVMWLLIGRLSIICRRSNKILRGEQQLL